MELAQRKTVFPCSFKVTISERIIKYSNSLWIFGWHGDKIIIVKIKICSVKYVYVPVLTILMH